MNYQLIEHPAPYIECVPDGELLTRESQALELVAACGEFRVGRLLMHSSSLPEAFFQLRSGLAGMVLLKFSNYRISLALVATPAQAQNGRFADLVLETNRGKEFRVFFDRDEAVKWLTSLNAYAW